MASKIFLTTNFKFKMQIQKSLDLNHPPRKGGSNGLMPFGEGFKNLNTNSKPNFAKNNISPSQNLQANSTLPHGEGDGIENYSKKTLNFAKELRKSQTNAEGLLWYYLKNKQLGGYKFKRQQPIDKYIVDFVCFEKKLIIELDGSQHNEDKNIKHDKIRDSFLRSLGFTILRFWNDEIFTNCFNILDFILHKLENPLDLITLPERYRTCKTLDLITLPEREGQTA
jgi:very-short-patch-repair endonuclease